MRFQVLGYKCKNTATKYPLVISTPTSDKKHDPSIYDCTKQTITECLPVKPLLLHIRLQSAGISVAISL